MSDTAGRAEPEPRGRDDGGRGNGGRDDGGRGNGGRGNGGRGNGGRVADLEDRLAEAQDLRLRAAADLDNLRKRCAVQVRSAADEARAQVARQWLPVIDDLERALEHAEADPSAIVEGIQAVRDEALSVLVKLGFARRDDTGATFDPTRHHAVASKADPGAPAGTVVEVVQPAYGDGDHQLRPAQVVVAEAD
jgi:molecular chaperone GrpE